MDNAIMNVVVALIGVVICAISTYAVPYIKTKYTKEQIDLAVLWTQKAVACAEIIFNIPHSGREKKEYVENFVLSIINKRKEVITRSELDVLIEAAVKAMNESAETKRVTTNE